MTISSQSHNFVFFILSSLFYKKIMKNVEDYVFLRKTQSQLPVRGLKQPENIHI